MKLHRARWLVWALLSGGLALIVWLSVSQSQVTSERMGSVLGRVLVRLPTLKPRPKTVNDPLVPNKPAKLVGQRDASASWVTAKLGSIPHSLLPKERDRLKKTPAERGGVNPCQTDDPGFGIYEKWRWGGGIGKLLVPVENLSAMERANTLFHFAGYELARKEVARAETPLVFVGVQFRSGGLNYRQHISGPHGLEALENAVSSALERVEGVPRQLGRIGLGAWSAGYDAVGVLLQQSANRERVDAVILLDGLHASREDEMADLQLKPFIEFAKRAARGEVFMFMSYSSVPTDRYASTHETGRRLIRALGGEPLLVEREDVGGLELKEMFSKGNFHARGYRGGGELDHCAHLMLYPMALGGLNRFWQTEVEPRGI